MWEGDRVATHTRACACTHIHVHTHTKANRRSFSRIQHTHTRVRTHTHTDTCSTMRRTSCLDTTTKSKLLAPAASRLAPTGSVSDGWLRSMWTSQIRCVHASPCVRVGGRGCCVCRYVFMCVHLYAHSCARVRALGIHASTHPTTHAHVRSFR